MIKFKQTKIKGVWYIKNFLLTDKRGKLIKIYDEVLYKKLKRNLVHGL